MTFCPQREHLVKTASAQRLVELLCEEVETEEEGLDVMRRLLAERPAVANEVLCRIYDVACYKVGDSCFRDQAPAHEHEQWFASTVVGSIVDSDEPVPLAPSEAEAQALAVVHLRLKEHFFGEALASA